MRHAQATFTIDANLRRIAATQLGLISVDQAVACGIDKHAIARRRDTGALVPVFRHVLRLAPFPVTPPQRALAAALAVPGSLIAATSAATVHQLPAGRATSDDEVLSVHTNRSIEIRGLTVVRQATPPRSNRWLTAHVTTPAATMLLLPRFVDDATVERCLDHCLAHRLTSVSTLATLIANTPARSIHNRALLLSLLANRGNGIGHRSGTEQLVGRWLTRAGLTGWTRNLRVHVDDFGQTVEVDFGWDGAGVALEVSPFFTHGSRAKQERDAHRRRLLAGVRWHVVEALDADIASERAFKPIVASLRSFGAT